MVGPLLQSARVLSLAALVAATVGVASPSWALIVSRWDGVGSPGLINTTAPADDPGWANLSSETGIYLGDGLYLTTIHTGTIGTVQLGGGSFTVIPGSGVALTNPASFGIRRQNNGTLSANSDLRLYRLGVDATTGLSPEELNPAIRRISIASRQPNTTTENLTIFGLGGNRILNVDNATNGQYSFDSNLNIVPYTLASSYRGFLNTGPLPPETRQWQWGTNQRTTQAVSGMVSSGSNILIEFAPVGSSSTIGNLYRFDENALPDEATGAGNDSGGPVFWKDNKGTPTNAADDEWVLAGLNHAVFPIMGNQLRLGVFGAFTAYSDLSFSHYRTQIEGARGRFSVMGDINLDGVVTGTIENGVATGDLAELVENWNYAGAAGMQSWLRGDLNQDGLTNLNDFVALRTALGGTVSTSQFALLVGAQGIPEPASAVLVVLGGFGALGRRRR